MSAAQPGSYATPTIWTPHGEHVYHWATHAQWLRLVDLEALLDGVAVAGGVVRDGL